MITERQRDLLLFIHQTIQECGLAPSYQEMAEELGLGSKSGINRLIVALEERGFIRRLPNRARAIEIIKLPETFTSVLIPKNPPHRNRDFLDWLRDQPCFISGMKTHDYETVVPAHTGTSGRGSKAPDKHSLPMAQSLHHRSHNEGVVTFWTGVFKKDRTILEALLTNYAENVYYKKYLREKGK